MPHKKSPAPTGNETFSNKSNYIRSDVEIKHLKKRLPPNGKFYDEAINGLSLFPDDEIVLIYIGNDEHWKYANAAKQLGMAPPIALSEYLNPRAYRWPVRGLRVRVIEWRELSEQRRDDLAYELDKAGAIEIQYIPWSRPPLVNPCRKAIYYE